MPQSLERQEAGIGKVSDKLVEPFKKIVNIAMQRVREGKVDELNSQIVNLSDDRYSGTVYKISDYLVEESLGVVKSIGDRSLGLHIEILQLGKENLYRIVYSMQLPRDPCLVTKESLSSLRRNKPKNVKMLAAALSSATKI